MNQAKAQAKAPKTKAQKALQTKSQALLHWWQTGWSRGSLGGE
jgi:hypothetical protein